MKNKFERDFLRRKKVLQKNLERKNLKAIAYNSKLSIEERKKLIFQLQKKDPNSSYVRVRNRCLNTFRSRSVYSELGLSRLELRRLASFGELPGFIKSN